MNDKPRVANGSWFGGKGTRHNPSLFMHKNDGKVCVFNIVFNEVWPFYATTIYTFYVNFSFFLCILQIKPLSVKKLSRFPRGTVLKEMKSTM